MYNISDNEIYKLFRGKTVALVGNSVALSNHCFGDAIDSHDIVCRVNKGPMLTTDAEKYGSRTDVLFYSNHQVLKDEDSDILDYLSADTKLVCRHDTETFDWPTHRISKHFYNYVVEISGYEDSNLHRKKIRKLSHRMQWPTNGLLAACYLQDCSASKISLFGFDWNQNKTFYKDQKKKEKMHNWSLEENYLRSQPDIKIMEMLCPES
jgi:hypothetical protein